MISLRELPHAFQGNEVPYGSSQTKRLTVPGAEEVLHKRFEVFDHGFVGLVDYMGGDEAVVQAARVSYGKGTKSVSEDRGLLRYLMRHRHTTPFEMVEFKWHMSMPIFVARQWIRHRTANVNEVSYRYSKPEDKLYVPHPGFIQLQSVTNHQGRSGESVSPDLVARVIELISDQNTRGMNAYNEMTNKGIARELARVGLPVGIYTQWYWKNDLHNTLRFLSLRMDPHAQKEIRTYANVMAAVLQRAVPHVWEAFEDYDLNAFSISAPEQLVVQDLLLGKPFHKAITLLPKRERREFLAKWRATRNRKPRT